MLTSKERVERIRELSYRVEEIARQGTELLIHCPNIDYPGQFFRSMVGARNALSAAAFSYTVHAERVDKERASASPGP